MKTSARKYVVNVTNAPCVSKLNVKCHEKVLKTSINRFRMAFLFPEGFVTAYVKFTIKSVGKKTTLKKAYDQIVSI